jgi:hypothetical protein
LKIDEKDLRELATCYFVPRLVAAEPETAKQWVMGAPPELRTLAIEVLAFNWYQSDPAGASAWVNSLQDRDHEAALKTIRRLKR